MRLQLLTPFLMVVAFPVWGQNAAPASDASTSAAAQIITVTAKKYEFSPSPIRVKQGAKVQLKITATDHVHGFRIATTPEGGDANAKPGLALSSGGGCNRIEQGQTITVEFVAQTAGTYPFKCYVHCGWRHRSMHGELIVEP